MRAVWIPRHGGPEVLEVRDGPDPEPGEGEVRIRVRAAGLNFAEVMARQGLYPDAPPPPMVAGYECAGIIDAVGEGVTDLAAGDRVAAMVRFGAHADTVCAPVRQVFPLPEAMSFEDAAAMPVNYLTAYHMLFEVARIRSGDRVLVHMAAGGVGTAVLQLCRTVEGVETFGTASGRKHDYVRAHGCDHPIDYHTTDYAEEVLRLTGGRGVDLVLDALGGRDWKKGYRILRPAGMLIAFGFANMNAGSRRRITRVLGQLTGVPVHTPMGLMSDNKAISGVNMGHLWGEHELLRREMAALTELYVAGRIRPHVEAVIPFDRAADAHRLLEDGKNQGKVLLAP
jgi:synaptic vesicle membrane protein VAT-1